MQYPKLQTLTSSCLLISSLLFTPAGHAVNKALIVGVGQYMNPDNNLPGIQLDVDMAQQVAQRLGIPGKNIMFLRDSAATTQGMRTSLKWLTEDVSSTDLVMIYVSSHGSHVPDKNGDEKDGADETLYLYDGHFLDDELYSSLRKIPSNNVMVFVDACHSGTGTRALTPNAYNLSGGKVKAVPGLGAKSSPGQSAASYDAKAAKDSSGQDNYISIGAAQDDQQSMATERGSLFTLALLETLENARTKNKSATWNDVFLQTKERVLATRAGFYPNLDGNPQMANNRIFAPPPLVSAAVASPAGPSSEAPATISQDDSNPLWTAVAKLADQGTPFSLKAPQRVKLGDKLQFNLNAPVEGYLNIISVGPEDKATLLFPNQYEANNLVKNGKILFPSPSSFVIRAVAPKGKLLVAAFISKEPINLLDYGMGNRDNNGKINSMFANLQRASFNLLNPPAASTTNTAGKHLYAAKLEITVE